MVRHRDDDEPVVQLATRIPKSLHHALRVHCATHDIVIVGSGAGGGVAAGE